MSDTPAGPEPPITAPPGRPGGGEADGKHAAVRHVAASPGVGPGVVDERWRIALHFHPDRLLADGRSVAEGLDAAGRWRTQYETGITAGSATAFPGGDRDRWEQHLFGPVYAAGPPSARPAYGGLDMAGCPDGPCPRFGSCFLRLRPHVLARSTFCVGDSYRRPTIVGTAAAFGAIAAALPVAAASPGAPGRALDNYVEAQVHGGVELARDVEAVVVDPAFRGTPTGAVLERLTASRGLPLCWHGGFVLDPDAVSASFRGPHLPPLLHRIRAAHGRVDAATLGAAAAGMGRDPETLQHVKHVWHAVVAFGQWGVGDHRPRPTLPGL